MLKAKFKVLLCGLYLLLCFSVLIHKLLLYFGNVFNYVPLLWKHVDELFCGSQSDRKVGHIWYMEEPKTRTCTGTGVCDWGTRTLCFGLRCHITVLWADVLALKA